MAIAYDPGDYAALIRLTAFRRSAGLDAEELDSRACRKLEPFLTPDVHGGVLFAGDWSVDTMARQVGLSSRQFSRRFKANFDLTPAGYLEALRLDEARLLLSTGQRSIAGIAHMTGFQSDDAFRRAFERRFRVAPGAYRDRFTSPTANENTDEIAAHT